MINSVLGNVGYFHCDGSDSISPLVIDGGGNEDEVRGLAIDATGNVYAAGAGWNRSSPLCGRPDRAPPAR